MPDEPNASVTPDSAAPVSPDAPVSSGAPVDSAAPAPAAAPVDAPGAPAEPAIDWQKRYTDTQADLTKANQEFSRTRQLLDTVTPHVNWDALRGGGGPKEDLDNEAPLTQADLQKVKQDYDNKLDVTIKTMEFRNKYPDYAHTKAEAVIGSLLANETDPYKSYEERLGNAVETYEGLVQGPVKTEVEKVRAEYEVKLAEAEGRQKSAAAASGLDSGGVTPPVQEAEVKEESANDLINWRNAQRHKKMAGR